MLIAELQNSDLLVDATPLGMPPLEGQSILYSFQSSQTCDILDICYAPPKTKLLELARENGFQAYNGSVCCSIREWRLSEFGQDVNFHWNM